ncbi:PTS sugar transporter subunit IIA [Spirochaeta dissipatitropha]
MSDLSRIIVQDKIIDLSETDHLTVLQQLIRTAMPYASADVQFHALEEIRSKSSSKEINLGKGFALSHARIDGISSIEISLGLFGRETGYLKGEPVHSVFCIIIPTDQSRSYLTIMSRLSRFLLQDGIDAIFLAGNHESILESIRTFDST